jgi:ribosomal protein S12 methylthiotransferase accessory factor
MDHARYYAARPDFLSVFQFLLDSRSKGDMNLDECSADFNALTRLQVCIDRIRDRGFEVYAVDLTPSEIRELGYHVCRVIVPDLVPIHFGHHTIPLGMSRLSDGETLSTHWPHPFS